MRVLAQQFAYRDPSGSSPMPTEMQLHMMQLPGLVLCLCFLLQVLQDVTGQEGELSPNPPLAPLHRALVSTIFCPHVPHSVA